MCSGTNTLYNGKQESVMFDTNGDHLGLSSNTGVFAGVVGTVVAVVILVTITISVVVYRRRNATATKKRDSSIQYYNCTDSTDSDQQYERMSPVVSEMEKVDNGSLNVYEGLQTTDYAFNVRRTLSNRTYQKKKQMDPIAVIFVIGLYNAALYVGIYGNETPILSILPEEAFENTNVTLTCSYNGPFTGEGFWWYLNTPLSEDIRYASIVENNCLALLGFIGNKTLYSYSCNSNNMQSVILKNIKPQNHGDEWQCGIVTGAILIKSNIVTVLVTVPVTNVYISPLKRQITIAENSPVTWTCSTSPCRPKPMFLWYVTNDNNPEWSRTVLSEIISTEQSTDQLMQYTNQLSITLNRTWNIRLFFCGAKNSKGDLILSDKVLLNVTYPPDGPPRIANYGNGSEINVIKDTVVNLKCLITGGNPLPRLEWNKNNDMMETVSGIEVSRDLRYQAIEKRNEEFICRAIQFNLIYTTYVTMNVLYPPDTPTIKIKTSTAVFLTVNKTLSVIEGLPFTLNCSADSNPPVKVFVWNDITNSPTYYIPKADRSNAGKLSCKVSNEMKTSDPITTETGTNSSFVEVNVLYPPTINTLRDATIIEGDNLNKLCYFIPGNPPGTNITWRYNGSTWDVNQQQPFIVSRNQSGVYKCSVRNLMVSSDGTRVLGNASGELYLSVQYKTKVLRFLINELNDNENITINENDVVNLTCEIEGIPLPTGQLLHQSFLNQRAIDLPRYLTSQTSTSVHLTSSFPAQCTDSGIHTCAGTNTLYNGSQAASNKSIALFVLCKPRKSSSETIIDTVKSPTLVDVTLSFTALAYPIPPKTGYVWTRNVETSDTWVNITSSGNKTNISTRGLQTNLTIKDISQFDYGLYRLFIFNDVGQYNHTFTIVPPVYVNDGSSALSSNVSVIAASAAGTVVGAVILVVVIIIMVYRKRKSLSYQKRECSMKYYNVSDSKVAELNIPTQVENANAYEAFQSTGSDQQYDSLSKDDCRETSDSDFNMSAINRSLNVYEGLRNTGFDQQYEQISPIAPHVEKRTTHGV